MVNRPLEPRVSSPNPLCTCEWVVHDTGSQSGSRVRVRETPGCKIHDKREEPSDSRGSESKEP